jgi:small-conductance mechanosensitive channel/CRP-like cAMP-binding protein
MMSFWNATVGFFWGEESFAVLLMVLVLAALLFHFRREDRKSLFDTLGFLFVCLLGQFASSLVHALEFMRAASVLHELFVIGGGIAVIRLWGLLLFRVVLPWIKLSPPRIAEDIVVIVAYAVWGLLRLHYAGIDTSSILATSAMMTAVLAFAMQDTLGNILGGLALQLDNSIAVGDWIKVDDIAGRVVDIRWRSTLVETRNWETVVFPNSQLMKNKFMVLGRRANQPVQWRRWVWFNVDLDVLPSKVIAVVEEILAQTDIENMAKQPLPNCLLMDATEKGYARYAVRYWLTDLVADDSTDARVRWHILAALQRTGIRLAMAEEGIHLTKENEKYEEGLHHREVGIRMKTLRQVELFSQMTDAELKVLAERLIYSPFAKGTLISRQGAVAHWLYVVIGGEAEVYLELPGGGKRVLRDLGKGNFFGEMGLMTGAPRSASVLAKTDVECYRLDKEMFEEIMHRRPAIAEEMSQVLATRRAEQEVALHELDAESARMGIPQRRGEILSTIRHFFGLAD